VRLLSRLFQIKSKIKNKIKSNQNQIKIKIKIKIKYATWRVTEHGGTRFHGVSIPRCQQMLALALTSLDVAEALAG
jgi:hypothetical protein